MTKALLRGSCHMRCTRITPEKRNGVPHFEAAERSEEHKRLRNTDGSEAHTGAHTKSTDKVREEAMHILQVVNGADEEVQVHWPRQ